MGVVEATKAGEQPGQIAALPARRSRLQFPAQPPFIELRELSLVTDNSLAGLLRQNGQEMYTAIAEESQSSDPQVNILVRKVGLLVRCLDQGMIRLSLQQKFAYLYQSMSQDSKMVVVSQTLFPIPIREAVACARIIAESTERFERFTKYSERVATLLKQHPRLLLVDGPRYNELDYWVEQTYMQNAKLTTPKTLEVLAKEVPLELIENGRSSELVFKSSLEYFLRRQLGLATTGIVELSRTQRISLLRTYLNRIDHEDGSHTYSATASQEEIAAAMDVSTDHIRDLIHYIEARERTSVAYPDWRKGPREHTSQLIRDINLVVDALEHPIDGSVGLRWEYDEISFALILNRLQTLPKQQDRPDYLQYSLEIVVQTAQDHMREKLPSLTRETRKKAILRDIHTALQKCNPPRKLDSETIELLLITTRSDPKFEEGKTLLEYLIRELRLVKFDQASDPQATIRKAKQKIRGFMIESSSEL